MHILIAVASRHGSTAEIAEAIARELRAANHTVELQIIDETTTTVSPDAVILGSAVYMGNWLPKARQFVERNWPRLAGVPTWLFSSGPLGHDDPQPQGNPVQIEGLVQATAARDHKVFVGKLDKHRLGLGERLITSVVKAPEGDFRDWQAIQAWAREIGTALVPAADGNNDLLIGAAT